MPQLAQRILEDQKNKLKKEGVISPYTFPWVDDEPSKQANYYKHWIRYLESAEISKTTSYDLRHTFVSVNKKTSVELLKPVVGQGVDFDTFKTYGHALDGEAEEAARLIDRAFQRLLK